MKSNEKFCKYLKIGYWVLLIPLILSWVTFFSVFVFFVHIYYCITVLLIIFLFFKKNNSILWEIGQLVFCVILGLVILYAIKSYEPEFLTPDNPKLDFWLVFWHKTIFYNQISDLNRYLSQGCFILTYLCLIVIFLLLYCINFNQCNKRINIFQKRSILGYGVLSLLVIFLVAVLIRHVLYFSITVFITMIFLLAGLLISVVFVFLKDKEIFKKDKLVEKDAILSFAFVFLSAVVSYYLVFLLRINCLIISPLVGLIGALVFSRFKTQIFCGSFVGMTNVNLFNVYCVLPAGILTSFIYVISERIFKGFGGKLGTIAFAGCMVTVFIIGNSLFDYDAFNQQQLLLIVPVSVLSAIITYILNVRLKLGPVMASSIIGLSAALLLFGFKIVTSSLLVTVIYGASFVGMTAKKVFSNEGLIALAGAIFGILFFYNYAEFNGIGGKLGITAFAAVMSLSGFMFIIKKSFICIKKSKQNYSID